MKRFNVILDNGLVYWTTDQKIIVKFPHTLTGTGTPTVTSMVFTTGGQNNMDLPVTTSYEVSAKANATDVTIQFNVMPEAGSTLYVQVEMLAAEDVITVNPVAE